MCGIVGIIGKKPVNQLLYNSLLLLQHRGQDAAGIATLQEGRFHIRKAHGLVKDVFRTKDIHYLSGLSGIGQVRYPTSGSSKNVNEAQPLYVNTPFGITLAHNGNLTNWRELKKTLYYSYHRHVNTDSDSEILLNVLAHELQSTIGDNTDLNEDIIFRSVAALHERVCGSYAVVAQISGYGLLAFRDPYGIRPLCIGKHETEWGLEWMVASESAALGGAGFTFFRDVAPGEIIFIGLDGHFTSHLWQKNVQPIPCLFEYVYFARSDSVIDGASVHAARLRMGEYLAKNIAYNIHLGDIDVVMPIPDSSRPAAMQLATRLNLSYREGFIKNPYVGRTFIMSGQSLRCRSIQWKHRTIDIEFKGKNVLLVDDSIVRGNTSKELVSMAKLAGANKVYFASAAPPVRFPNIYGIDIPNQEELIAAGRCEEEVARIIGVDRLLYQDLNDLKQAVLLTNPNLVYFEASCFDGSYITSDVRKECLFSLQ